MEQKKENETEKKMSKFMEMSDAELKKHVEGLTKSERKRILTAIGELDGYEENPELKARIEKLENFIFAESEKDANEKKGIASFFDA